MKYSILLLGLIACRAPISVVAPVEVRVDTVAETPVEAPKPFHITWEVEPHFILENGNEIAEDALSDIENGQGHYTWRNYKADMSLNKSRMYFYCSDGMRSVFSCEKDAAKTSVSCGYMEFHFVCYVK